MTDVINGSGSLVFATVGTDHHPFDRLVRWIDEWVGANAERGVTGLVQTGTTARPLRTEFADYLGHEAMEQAVRNAAVVVTHGGPGSIMLCSYLGKRPIVVPRQSRLGEHVDDHQVLFCRRLAADGRVELAESREQLAELLERALFQRRRGASVVGREHVSTAVRTFERLVEDLVSERPPRRRRDKAISAG